MTTWGFKATNANGQVLVSSETRNLHFVGKATLNRIIRQLNGYGGLRHYAFRINCNVTPTPFFSMPTDDYYGVVAVREVSANVWEIEIIRSGTSSTEPEVYVFSDPRGVTARNTNYGMVVNRDDGTPSFDSRLSPLTVTGGTSVAPPSNPKTVGFGSLSAQYCSSDTSGVLGPDNRNTYTFTAPGGKPIFYYPSLAQAEREYQYHESEKHCTIVDYGVCIGWSEEQNWNSWYWAFYRSGIRYVGGYLFCGWITAQVGCHWTHDSDSSLFGIIPTGSDSSSIGQWPYSNETLNMTPTAVITANGSRYDD